MARFVPIDIGQANNVHFSNFFGGSWTYFRCASNNIDEQEKSRFGKIGYLLSAVRTIGENAPFSYKLDYMGIRLKGKQL